MVQELTHEQLANYADDRRLTIMGSIVTFLILGNISVAARIFTELRTRRRIFSEDIHIVLAVVIKPARHNFSTIFSTESFLGLPQRSHWQSVSG